MDFFVIPPLRYLYLMDFGDRYFCLAQLYLKSEEYRNFFRTKVKEKSWVLLDNGIGDHSPVSQEDLYEIMIDLQPNEVIPVDTLFDKNQTLKNLDDFIDKMEKKGLNDIEIFACPQGNNVNEWLECYIYMLNHPKVNTIGMSKLSIPWCFANHIKGDKLILESRHIAYEYLKINNLIKKPLHFLGLGDPCELKYYKNDEFVRSNDSCNFIWSAINGMSWNKSEFDRIPTPHDYFDKKMTNEQILVAIQNIDWVKKSIERVV